MTRAFLVTGHDAATGTDWTTKDLPGSAGRLDVLVRCATSALLTSHGVREDTTVYLVLQGPPDAPKTVRFRGAELQHVNPDERSTALIVRKALDLKLAGGLWRESTPGVAASDRGLAQLEEELADRDLVVLHEDGKDVTEADLGADPAFALSDHRDFADDELELLDEWGATRVSLGERAYHADDCVTVAQWWLDRR